jgi:integrase
MPRPKGSVKTPSLTHHNASNRAVVRIDGRDEYCGPWGSVEAKEKYERLIAEWILRGRQPAADPTELGQPPSFTVSQLIAAYWQHSQDYYRHADGTPTSEVECIRHALRRVRRLYGASPVTSFGPLALKAVQRDMAAPKQVVDPKTGKSIDQAGWCRTNINRAVTRIKTMFKWGVGNELIPAHVYQGIAAVPGLRAGRSMARENERVMPVENQNIDAVLPHVSPQVRAMIELQRVTGMRPGEVVNIRGCEIEMGAELWVYRPSQHKTLHHGHSRKIYLGPRAREIIEPFLRTDVSAFLFSPAEADQLRRARQHEQRKTPPTHGNRPGSNRRRSPKRRPCDRYTVASYRRSIARACDAADRRGKGGMVIGDTERLVPRWSPHQLRHTAATRLRRDFGLEAAQVILGHKTLTATQIYAEKNVVVAQRIMADVG